MTISFFVEVFFGGTVGTVIDFALNSEATRLGYTRTLGA